MPVVDTCPECGGEVIFCQVEVTAGSTHLGQYCLKCKRRMRGLLPKSVFPGSMAELIRVPCSKENRLPRPSKATRRTPEYRAQVERDRPLAIAFMREKRAVAAIPITQPLPSSAYREYIKSKAWKAKSAECISRFKGRCAVCYGTVQLQAHHRTYDRLGCEEVEDLTCLCGDCHTRFHGILQKKDMPK